MTFGHSRRLKFDHCEKVTPSIYVWRAEARSGKPAVQAHNQREHQRGTREYEFTSIPRENIGELSVLVAKLGGITGVVEKLSLVRIDKNGTNEIDDNEMRLYEDSVMKLVQNTKDQLLNVGVVAALLLSVVYEFALDTEIEPSANIPPTVAVVLQTLYALCQRIVARSRTQIHATY